MAYFSKLNTDFLTASCPSLSVSDELVSSFDRPEYIAFPGFCDVHVHFREPGFSYKEDMASGSRAAAHGGYTTVCAMPNLSPVPDNMEHLEEQLRLIREKAVISVVPYGSITMGEKGETLSDMEAMAPFVAAFSDDGCDVESESMMRAAMEKAKTLGKIVAAHCEVRDPNRGCIHNGTYAREHGHRGITSESEYLQVARDVRLAKETGCAYHVCHISTKESVDIIRKAKAEGTDVTCETAPHYLLLDDSDLREDGRFKMNPPVRDKKDREALIEGVLDGTVDMVATDHAPHAAHEKNKGLEGSAFGIVGLETAFPALYTGLVQKGIITLEHLVRLLSVNPRRRFGLPLNGDFNVFDLHTPFKVDPAEFFSKGRATPFEGETFYGKCLLTVHEGKAVYHI